MTYSTNEWLREWRAMQHCLEWTGLPQGRYDAALAELAALRDLVGLDTSSIGDLGLLRLRPFPGDRLARHPLPVLFRLQQPGWDIWVDLTRLGLALVATKDLGGIKSKRRNLADRDQYLSTLFEIEVLAELVEGGLRPTIQSGTPDGVVALEAGSIGVEMRLKEAPTAVAVTQGVLYHVMSVGPEPQEMLGRIQIRLKSGAGGGPGQFTALLGALKADLASLRARPGSRDCPEYQITYDPGAADNTIEVNSGPAGETYIGQLENMTKGTIEEKDKKLTASWNAPSVVALDLRSFGFGLPGEGSRFATDPYYQQQIARSRTREHREALINGIRAGVQRATSVRAVAAWWRRLGLSRADELFRPWEITWTSAATHLAITDPMQHRGLYEGLL